MESVFLFRVSLKLASRSRSSEIFFLISTPASSVFFLSASRRFRFSVLSAIFLSWFSLSERWSSMSFLLFAVRSSISSALIRQVWRLFSSSNRRSWMSFFLFSSFSF
jgi:hypothetical protein